MPARLAWCLAWLSCCCGCRHVPRQEPARPPLELPAEWIEAYRPRNPGFGLEFRPGEEKGVSYESLAFRFTAFHEGNGDFERVEGRYYRSLEVPHGEKAPLLLISPILAGAVDNYLACRVFARWACQHGISAYYIHQEENILAEDRDAVDLERTLRQNIQDNIRALDLLLGARKELDGTRLGSLGISMGALKNVVLIAVEPRFSWNVLCLAGADLPEILRTSRERRVVRYLQRRSAIEGVRPEEICDEFAAWLQAEPALFARAIDNRRVLLFLGTIDDKVPYATGLVLREMLGQPEAYLISLGHYTAIVSAPFVAQPLFRFFEERFGLTTDTSGDTEGAAADTRWDPVVSAKPDS